ncbi:MAG: tRNA preQ1(34) S-adenosylmethionine ribosyltransferase-isomerase QueA [Pseudomonadota bacterium]
MSDYDYTLPDGRIALRPVEPRDAARLLVHRPGAPLADHFVRDITDLLAPGDVLVVNDSKVIPARLTGARRRGAGVAAIEVTLLHEVERLRWRGFARPAKRLAQGDTVSFGTGEASVDAEVISRDGPYAEFVFSRDPLAAGVMPLPPYIAARRAPDGRDLTDYQTVYAEPPGSVAAPTAGLHFTRALLAGLEARGVGLERVTLHVGPGTFLPVTAEEIDAHEMHAEAGYLSAQTATRLLAAKAKGGRIVAVGTTALRLLESAARSGTLSAFEGDTDLFIRPGFQFRVADALMTNFHLPRSTLLMLVAGFMGFEPMRALYAHALEEGYRFYSYGDASLIFRS